MKVTLQVAMKSKRLERRQANNARFKRELEYIAYDARNDDADIAVRKMAAKSAGKRW